MRTLIFLITRTLLVIRYVILFPLSWLLGARGARCSEYSHGTAACPNRDRSAATSCGSQKGAKLAVGSAVAGPVDGTLRGLMPMHASIHPSSYLAFYLAFYLSIYLSIYLAI